MSDVLANAVWHSLGGGHKVHAQGNGLARGYDPDVSVFHAIDQPTPDAWHALAGIATNGVVVLFREAPLPDPPAGWRVLFAGEGHQMVRTSPGTDAPPLPREATMRSLTVDDVDAMTELVTRTEPGPWRPRTVELGGYVGIFHGHALVAMAGRRLWPPGYREISAVCTDPSARRRGYGSIVTNAVADAIAAEGDVPMLHVADDNPNARAVYEQLGFETVRMCGFSALGVPR
ncbi:MAG TPA: GNAT family N-acetyltransferase [Acidimicrobiales bacterium]|nr:GNAT family N-acetyltransferase [Acidimicrobiales bacterium]